MLSPLELAAISAALGHATWSWSTAIDLIRSRRAPRSRAATAGTRGRWTRRAGDTPESPPPTSYARTLAAPVYSTLFQSEELVGGGLTILPVPSDVTWVLRDLTVFRANNGTFGGYFYMTLDGVYITGCGLPPFISKPFEWHGRVVCPPSTEVQLVFSAGSGKAHVTLSGYTLTLP